MIDNDRIGRAIRTLRRKVGMTQEELANALFISKVAVSKWERGKSVPDIDTLRKLSVLLDMDVDGLIDGTASYSGDHWKGVIVTGGVGIPPCDTVLYDKPVIDYIISYFLLAGIRDILIFCSDLEKAFIEGRFRGGDAIGIRLTCVTGDGAYLSRFPLDQASRFEGANVMLMTEPFLIYGVDLTRFFQRAMQHRNAAVNMTSVVGKSPRSGYSAVQGNREKDFSHYDYQHLPLFFLPHQQFAALVRESSWFETLMDMQKKGTVRAEPMDKGFLVAPFYGGNLDHAATLVRIIQELSGYTIYCPLEIAWRRGMISREEMKAEAKDNTGFLHYFPYVEMI